jgi:hypothetical protein
MTAGGVRRRRTAPIVAVLLAAACSTSRSPVAGGAPAGTPAPAPTTSTAPVATATTTRATPSSVAPSSSAVPPSIAPTIAPASIAPTPPAPASGSGPQALTLAFGGDVHFAGEDAQRLATDPTTAIGPIAETLRSADLAMVNLETAITTGGTPAVKAFTFRAPATAFDALRSAGIDVVTMANNHGEDYGPVGLQDTLSAAAAAAFPVVGIGQTEDDAFAPYQVTVKGQRVAVIGATQVLDAKLMYAWSARGDKPGLASAYNVPRLVRAVREARATSDLVVVYLHWGHELASCPASAQRDIARQLVDAGADSVVGSHAHVQLGAGRLGSGYVDYGLGNFVFYVYGSSAVTRSGVLLLTVTGRRVTAQQWVPAQITGGIPVPLTGAAAAERLEQWQDLRTCAGLDPVTTPG